jgi:hypothetical protein
MRKIPVLLQSANYRQSLTKIESRRKKRKTCALLNGSLIKHTNVDITLQNTYNNNKRTVNANHVY